MSTKAQIKANRQNAQKSTGPQTAEGKAVVSQNAVKHGLFAAEAVISVENPADYQLYRDEYLAELLPVGMVESMLAERIVSLAWRLQRAERMHNEAIDVMLATVETNEWQKCRRDSTIEAQDPRAGGLELILGWATNDDFSNSRVLERLLMYERRIENSLDRTIHKLKKYQLMRHIQEADARKQESARAIPKACGFEAATRRAPAYTLSDLKKQSQFAAAHLGAKPLMQGDYNNIPACGDDENKAKRSQSQALESTKGVGTREKSVTAATSLAG